MNILVFVGLLSYSWAFPSQPRKQKLQDSLTQGGLYIVFFLFQVQSKQYGNDVLILMIMGQLSDYGVGVCVTNHLILF